MSDVNDGRHAEIGKTKKKQQKKTRLQRVSRVGFEAASQFIHLKCIVEKII